MLLSAAVLLALPLVQAAPWAQPADSSVHSLFKRQDASKYPPSPDVPVTPSVDSIPKEWLDKLKSVQIANVPVAKADPASDNAVIYPDGTDLKSPEVCAATTGCQRADDIVALPEGIFGLTFDDGPGDGTQMLSDFLHSKQMSTHATHFFIGSNIVREPAGFKLVYDRGGHIAGHTWSHPRLTSKTNEEIVGELGWTMQVIYDNTGGRIPQFWRPPFGDLDERVRDIAKNVFGLKTVLWNSDTNDWKIASQGKGPVEEIFDQWATGPKSPGHSVLMHEINVGTVEVFIAKYPNIEKNGWKFQNLAEAIGEPMYLNAADNTGEVQQQSLLGGGGSSSNSTAPPAEQSGAQSGAQSGTQSGTQSGGSATGSAESATGSGSATPTNNPGSHASKPAAHLILSLGAVGVAAIYAF